MCSESAPPRKSELDRRTDAKILDFCSIVCQEPSSVRAKKRRARARFFFARGGPTYTDIRARPEGHKNNKEAAAMMGAKHQLARAVFGHLLFPKKKWHLAPGS